MTGGIQYLHKWYNYCHSCEVCTTIVYLVVVQVFGALKICLATQFLKFFHVRKLADHMVQVQQQQQEVLASPKIIIFIFIIMHITCRYPTTLVTNPCWIPMSVCLKFEPTQAGRQAGREAVVLISTGEFWSNWKIRFWLLQLGFFHSKFSCPNFCQIFGKKVKNPNRQISKW